MKIDPKLLIPMKLEDFRPDGHMYLLEGPGEYQRVSFPEDDLKDPWQKAQIMWWMVERADKLFLLRNNPWGTLLK